MPFTLIGFHKHYGAAATYDAVTGIPDEHVTVFDEDIIVPELSNIAGCWVGGGTLTHARLATPSLRALVENQISPIEAGVEPASPPAWIDYSNTPITLVPTEALNLEASVTGAGDVVGILMLSDGAIPSVAGKIITVQATSGTTLTPFGWTNGRLNFTQTLPAGRYNVVGMRAMSAGLIAARLVIPGYAWRPGCLGVDTMSKVTEKIFRHGKLGIWGSFTHNQPPTIDFLSSSADTSETVELDLIKIE